MDMQERALAYLDDGELVQLTRNLVRIRSINPPGDEAAVATSVAERFERAGIFADVVPHEEVGRASVVGGIRGTGRGSLPPYGRDDRPLDARRVRARRHEHRQHVDRGRDDRLWPLRLHGYL